MPLSWNEIRARSLEFSKEWEDASSENADAKPFWIDFFDVFGISRRRVASFEEPVRRIENQQGFIDLFWKGVLLVEHKSRGRDLDKAYTQALDYFSGLKEKELPKYVIVSDFARIRLYDLEEETEFEFDLKDLHKNITRFGFIAGYQAHTLKAQDPVNLQAAEQMGRLHDLMKESGYKGHDLEVYLVRLLFCLFAEDTGIFERQQFQEYIDSRTLEDGSDLALHLDTLFFVLNTEQSKRLKTRDEQLAEFPYVNGRLFEERLTPAAFDSKMRRTLLDCCALDWALISPAIFGSLFQSIMDKKARRDLGAHYTSEENILKLLRPLFLDELWAEFEKAKNNKNRLRDFHEKLRTLTFFDPACGCGNFLVVAYRELRILELEILREQNKSGQMVIDIGQLIKLDVDQFFGIEIEEFPAQIAQTALWLMDHQMNTKVSEEFGLYFVRIPLRTSANIFHGNALHKNWSEVIDPERLSYILGNPPFLGKKEQSPEQKAEVMSLFRETRGAGVLDYVCCWYSKAVELMDGNRSIEAAFVSTNSITQGEQVGALWSAMFERGVNLDFAHRTFQWNNEARGKAAVHVVIIGFSLVGKPDKWLFDYEKPNSEPQAIKVKEINQYLVPAPRLSIDSRSKPLQTSSPELNYGSMPIDKGWLILSTEEREEIIQKHPDADDLIKRYTGGEEYINDLYRYCLWLKDVSPSKWRHISEIRRRVEENKKYREGRERKQTIELAKTPSIFGEIRQPTGEYLLIPKVSSSERRYIPIGFVGNDVIANGSSLIIPNATKYHFGILHSSMHMAWVRTVGGRMKSDYQYSTGIIFNNFPWPENPPPKVIQTIESTAEAVLEARGRFQDDTLADLYDPVGMPAELAKAHRNLDRAVDKAYGQTSFKSEPDRVAYIFSIYKKLVL